MNIIRGAKEPRNLQNHRGVIILYSFNRISGNRNLESISDYEEALHLLDLLLLAGGHPSSKTTTAGTS